MGRFRRREAFGLEVKELLVDRRTFALPGIVARGRGALLDSLGISHQPTLGHPVVAQLKTLIVCVAIKTMSTVPREGVRDPLGDRAHGVGKACDKAEGTEVGGVALSSWYRFESALRYWG